MEGYIVVAIFFSVRLQIYRRHRSVWNFARWTMVHIGHGQVFSSLGAMPQGIAKIQKFWPKFWPFDREYLENSKSQRLHVIY